MDVNVLVEGSRRSIAVLIGEIAAAGCYERGKQMQEKIYLGHTTYIVLSNSRSVQALQKIAPIIASVADLNRIEFVQEEHNSVPFTTLGGNDEVRERSFAGVCLESR